MRPNCCSSAHLTCLPGVIRPTFPWVVPAKVMGLQEPRSRKSLIAVSGQRSVALLGEPYDKKLRARKFCSLVPAVRIGGKLLLRLPRCKQTPVLQCAVDKGAIKLAKAHAAVIAMAVTELQSLP